MTLDGEVTSGHIGADWSRGRTMAGLILSHSRGDGGYRVEAGSGTVSSTLTGVYPWARNALGERVEAWGVAGYSEGTLTLTQEDQPAIRADLDLMVDAVGLRGVVVTPPQGGGPEQAIKTGALAVRTTTARVRGLSSAEAEVTRLRLGLEGSWAVGLEGGVLTPSLEIGARHDGDDAEIGTGADIGGAIAWSDPGRGLATEIRGRDLLSHEAAGFRKRGLSGSLAFDPTPGSARGFSLTLTQTMGAAGGGMAALLERATMTGLAANGNGGGGDDLANRRFEMRLGYGFAAFGDQFTSTPGAGLGLSNGSREMSLGWTLVRDNHGTGSLELALEATRHENDNAPTGAEHAIGLQLTVRW